MAAAEAQQAYPVRPGQRRHGPRDGFRFQPLEGPGQVGDLVAQMRDDAELEVVRRIEVVEMLKRRAPIPQGPRLPPSLVVAGITQALEEARSRRLGYIGRPRELGGGVARQLALMLQHDIGQTLLQRRQQLVYIENAGVERSHRDHVFGTIVSTSYCPSRWVPTNSLGLSRPRRSSPQHVCSVMWTSRTSSRRASSLEVGEFLVGAAEVNAAARDDERTCGCRIRAARAIRSGSASERSRG